MSLKVVKIVLVEHLSILVFKLFFIWFVKLHDFLRNLVLLFDFISEGLHRFSLEGLTRNHIFLLVLAFAKIKQSDYVIFEELLFVPKRSPINENPILDLHLFRQQGLESHTVVLTISVYSDIKLSILRVHFFLFFKHRLYLLEIIRFFK